MRPHITSAVLSAAFLATAPTLLLAPTSYAADEAIGTFGEPINLVHGQGIQSWAVDQLQISTDDVSYPIQGTLWEASATSTAIEGSTLPIIPAFLARTPEGEEYRVLFQIASAEGISPARLDQGQTSTGKIYFDVTGGAPTAVVHDGASSESLTWTLPQASSSTDTSTDNPPVSSADAPRSRGDNDGTASSRSDSPTSTPRPVRTAPLTDELSAPQPPPGWQGTPLPPGSQGTPLPPPVSAESQPPSSPTRQGTIRQPGVVADTRTSAPANGPAVDGAATPALPELHWQGAPLTADAPLANSDAKS